MRRRTLLCCGLVASLVLAGCSDDGGGGSDAPAATTVVPLPVAISPLEVTLVSPGPAPLALMAHNFTPHDRWRGHLTFTVDVGTGSTLAVEGPSTLANESVDGSGAVTAAYALDGLDLTTTTAEGAETAADDALTITGHVVVDEHRTATDATVLSRSSGEVPGVDSIASALDPRLPSILFPFPTEPISPGAQWDIEGPLSLLGAQVDLEARAELTRRRGDRFRVTVLLRLNTPESAGGAEIHLNGAGDITGRLDQLGPVRGSVTLGGTIAPDDPEDTRPLNLQLRIREQ